MEGRGDGSEKVVERSDIHIYSSGKEAEDDEEDEDDEEVKKGVNEA